MLGCGGFKAHRIAKRVRRVPRKNAGPSERSFAGPVAIRPTATRKNPSVTNMRGKGRYKITFADAGGLGAVCRVLPDRRSFATLTGTISGTSIEDPLPLQGGRVFCRRQYGHDPLVLSVIMGAAK